MWLIIDDMCCCVGGGAFGKKNEAGFAFFVLLTAKSAFLCACVYIILRSRNKNKNQEEKKLMSFAACVCCTRFLVGCWFLGIGWLSFLC